MPLHISHATNALDVTISNGIGCIYLTGDESTDGSIRICSVPEDPMAHIEMRTDGVWNDTGFRFASSSVNLGRDLQLSAVGGFLETVNPSMMVDHLKTLIPHIEFTDQGTQNAAHMPILDIQTTFDVFTGPQISEITGTTLGQTFSVDPTRILHSVTHLTGSISSSAPIQISYYKGNDNTGDLLNRMMLPTNKMVATQPFTIVYDSDFGFENVTTIFFEFISDNTLSLATNAGGDVITSQDGHILDELDVMLDEFVFDNDLNFVLDNDLNFVVHNRFP